MKPADHDAATCPNPRCVDGWITRDSDGSQWRCRENDCPSRPAAKFGPTERMLLRFGLVVGFTVGCFWGAFLFWAATR